MFTPVSAILLSLFLSLPAVPSAWQGAPQASADSPSPAQRTETWPLDAAWGRDHRTVVGRPSRFESLADTIARGSGANVEYVESANSLVIRGSEAQLETATSTLERLVAEAKKLTEQKKAERDADESREVTGQLSVDFPGGSIVGHLKAVGTAANFDSFLIHDLSAMKELPKEEVQRVLDAVTIAVELDGSSPAFRAKYHEGSRLLIVRGSSAERDLVRQVFRARVPGFQGDLAPKTPAAPTTPRGR